MLLATTAGELFSQTGGSALSYTGFGSSARIIGIGNAYVAGTQLGIYGAYNPAQVSLTAHNQVEFSTALLSFDRSVASASIAFPLPPNAGLQLHVLYAGVTDFDGRTPSGYHTEKFGIHDFQASASFGLRLNQRLSIGTTARFLMARYHPEVNSPLSLGIDIGLLYQIDNEHAIGFSIQDMLSEITWDTQELYNTPGSIQRKDVLPTRIKLGSGHRLMDGDLTLYSELEYRIRKADTFNIESYIDGYRASIRTRIVTDTFTSWQFRGGISWRAHERLTVQSGWQSGDFGHIRYSHRPSIGFTLLLPFDLYSPEIDYTLLREPEGIAWAHMFSIRLHINK